MSETTNKVSTEVQEEVKEEIVTGKKNKLSYETTVTLPSKGILYKGYKTPIPAEISLRGMTTKEEKILYASQGGNVFKKILSNCITEPKGIDVNKLIAADEMFLIIQLRMVTYGPEYRVQVRCPHCGRLDTYTIDLSQFDVNYLPDDFEEPIKVELPRSGDSLELRILRNEDTEEIDRYSKKFSKEFNLPLREVEYTSRMAKYINKINGEPVDFINARAYVDEMNSYDSARFWTVLNKIVVGVDTRANVVCSGCGEDFDFNMPVTSEFFRPTIE